MTPKDEYVSNDEYDLLTDEEEICVKGFSDLADWHTKTLESFNIQSSGVVVPRDAHNAVRRDHIGRVLGGNLQSAFTKTRDGRTLVFAKPDQNPFLPPSPGEHGLLFTFNWRTDAQSVSLFVRDAKDAMWTYMGEYVKKHARELSQEEWNLQPDKVKQIRAKSVFMRKYAKHMTDRVAKTTDSKIATHADIRAALDAGNERIQVIAMECVAYDATIGFLLRGSGSSQVAPRAVKRRHSSITKPALPKPAKCAKGDSEEDDRSASDEAVSIPLRRKPRRAAQRCAGRLRILSDS